MPDPHERFTVLYDTYQPRVYAYAASRAGHQLAEEVVSETFLVAWRRLDDIPGHAELPWLFRVARNMLSDNLRQVVRREALQAELRTWTESAALDAGEQATERVAVLRALARMSDADKELLTLTTWHGLSAAEAAEVLGCTKAVFFVRPSRPRRTLLTGLRLTAVAAVAVAAVVFVRSTDARLATPVAMSARTVLLAAAERIETATPATGRYWHTVGLSMALRNAGQGPPGGGTPKSVGYRVTCTHELWMAKSGRDPSWLVVTAQSGKPLTGADEETWRLQGRWRLGDCDGAGVPGVGPLTAPPFAVRLDDKRNPEVSYPMVGATPVTTKQVMDLPADPAALKKVLQQWDRQAGQQSDEALFAEAVSLLSQLPTTPRIRAALYRMLADLPGVKNLGRISDPLGRVGTGIELQGGTQRIVIDEASGRPLAMEDRLDGDELSAWTALTASGWTDARPVLPEQR